MVNDSPCNARRARTQAESREAGTGVILLCSGPATSPVQAVAAPISPTRQLRKSVERLIVTLGVDRVRKSAQAYPARIPLRSRLCHSLVKLHYSHPGALMTETIRVFVNTTALNLPAGADVGQAVHALDPELAASVERGAAYVTDGRGIEVDPAASLASGSILRVVVRARRGADADA